MIQLLLCFWIQIVAICVFQAVLGRDVIILRCKVDVGGRRGSFLWARHGGEEVGAEWDDAGGEQFFLITPCEDTR